MRSVYLVLMSSDSSPASIAVSRISLKVYGQYSLVVNVDPVGCGSFTPDLAGPYYYGDVVTLNPSANSGYTFSGWSGDVAAGSGDT